MFILLTLKTTIMLNRSSSTEVVEVVLLYWAQEPAMHWADNKVAKRKTAAQGGVVTLLELRLRMALVITEHKLKSSLGKVGRATSMSLMNQKSLLKLNEQKSSLASTTVSFRKIRKLQYLLLVAFKACRSEQFADEHHTFPKNKKRDTNML